MSNKNTMQNQRSHHLLLLKYQIFKQFNNNIISNLLYKNQYKTLKYYYEKISPSTNVKNTLQFYYYSAQSLFAFR